MPEDNNQTTQSQSPFEVVTTAKNKKVGSTGIIVGVLVVILLGLGVFFGVRLVQQNQEIREKAGSAYCPGAEACPVAGQPNLLRNCTPSDSDNTPQDSLCNTKGRIASCGGKQYCCPSVGGSWTANMTACQATPTATATATASSTPTIAPLVNQTSTPKPSVTPTSTSKSTSVTPTPTKAPIPATGTSWPTILGAGLGILVVVGSILLAL